MDRLLRRVSKNLWYRPLLHLVSQTLHLESIDELVESVSSWLRTQVPYPIAFKGPKRKYIGFAVVKYGILDLTFSVEQVDWTHAEQQGLPRRLKELGFAMHPRDLSEGAVAEQNDPTCLTELQEDIDKNETLLRLFLEKRPGGLGDPEYFKQMVLTGRLQKILRASEAGDEAFQRVVQDCFPDDFTVSDACLTNAEFVWFQALVSLIWGNEPRRSRQSRVLGEAVVKVGFHSIDDPNRTRCPLVPKPRLSACTRRWVNDLFMRQIALSFLLAGLTLYAQPDLRTQAPAVIARCAPQYTHEAKRASIEGTVVLYIQVYPDGRAHNIKVQSSLGSGLDEKAIEAVQQWRFSPGTKHGKPVVVPATIEVKFRLNDTSEPCRAGPPQTEPKPQNGRV